MLYFVVRNIESVSNVVVEDLTDNDLLIMTFPDFFLTFTIMSPSIGRLIRVDIHPP